MMIAVDLRRTVRLAARGVALALALGVAVPAVQAQAPQVTLKVAHFLPTSSITHSKFIVPWCERIRAQSQGRMVCQIYPSMQLGGTPPQLFDQVRDGVADVDAYPVVSLGVSYRW